MFLAQVLAMTGDRDGAFDKLSKLVKLPSALNHGDLKLNPVWDDVRDDTRFDRILAESALPLATSANIGFHASLGSLGSIPLAEPGARSLEIEFVLAETAIVSAGSHLSGIVARCQADRRKDCVFGCFASLSVASAL
jgi:hypothetical protein